MVEEVVVVEDVRDDEETNLNPNPNLGVHGEDASMQQCGSVDQNPKVFDDAAHARVSIFEHLLEAAGVNGAATHSSGPLTYGNVSILTRGRKEGSSSPKSTSFAEVVAVDQKGGDTSMKNDENLLIIYDNNIGLDFNSTRSLNSKFELNARSEDLCMVSYSN
ncbi:hypothetical protein L6452_15233 [Arctium lappa]|uniref:Uncharacterized protein n=1 Tax=Arctium lappa TaxID=4217 RepID=A0ACB9CNF8_ARCLA|nr:hypothetical protein L6452_15233 [Arctium lappa]